MTIDQKALDELRTLDPDGSDGVLEQLINVYLKDASRLLGQIKLALAAQDIATLARHAHSLKSSSLSLGASRVGELAHEIEAHARKNNVDELPDLIVALSEAYAAAQPLLQAEIPVPGKPA